MINNNGVLGQIYKEKLIPISKVRVFDTKNINSYFSSTKNINELSNGSFEDWTSGLPTDWQEVGSYDGLESYEIQQSSDSHFGNYSAKIKIVNPAWDDFDIEWDALPEEYTWDFQGNVEAFYFQNFTYTNEIMYAGCHVKGKGFIGVRFMNSQNHLISSKIIGFSSSSYFDCRFSFEVPENTSYCQIILGTNNDGEEVFFDGAFVSDNPNFIFGSISHASYDEIIPMNVSLKKEIGMNSVCNFPVAKENRFIYSNGGFGILNKYNIVEVHLGYRDEDISVNFYQKSFVGVITRVVSNTDNTLNVDCVDFAELFKSKMNEGYPNYNSYIDMPLDAGFRVYREQIKKDFYPTGYDNWLLENVIRDLSLKVGFPLDFADIFPSNIRLSVGSETYPYSEVNGESKMLYQFDWGKPIWDIMLEIASEFGYFCGFDHEGRLKFYPIGNWQTFLPEDITYDNNFKLEKDQFSVDNPTWRFITNEDNLNSGEILINNLSGSNFRLYTIGDKSDGKIKITIFYTDEDENYVSEEIGIFDVKGQTDDGSAFFSNYIDVYVNDNKYLGGKMVGQITEGKVAIAGYGFNSDKLSAPQMVFTSVNDIISREAEISAEDIRNEVLVIGQTRLGRDIAVRAVDTWSIHGGRRLTLNDFVFSATPAISDNERLFSGTTEESVLIPDDCVMEIAFNGAVSQMVTGMEIFFDMPFGSKIDYEVRNISNDELLYNSTKISDSNAGNLKVLDDDLSSFDEFYVGTVANSTPFVANKFSINFLVSGGDKKTVEIVESGFKQNIVDVSEFNEFVFILTENKVYRYDFLQDELIDYSNVPVSAGRVSFIVARNVTEAVVFGHEKLFRTNFGTDLVEFTSYTSGIDKRFIFEEYFYPINKKPVIYGGTLFIGGKSKDVEVDRFDYFNKSSGTLVLSCCTLDVSDINSSPIYEFSSTIVNSLSVGSARKNNLFMMYVNKERRFTSDLWIIPNTEDSGTWERRNLDGIIGNYNDFRFYNIGDSAYFFSSQKVERRGIFINRRYEKVFSPILKEVRDDYNVSVVNTLAKNCIMINDFLENNQVDVIWNENGLYYQYFSVSFEEPSHSAFKIDIEKSIPGVKIKFNNVYPENTEIKISEIDIYSRDIMSIKDLQPSNIFSFDTKTKPLFGSWDSMVGNTGDRTLPYYNYQTADLPPNYIGTKKTLIYKDGRLNNEAICAWMAQHFLHRYRKRFFEYKADIIGNPLLELNDCIQFIDSENNLSLSNNFWIESIAVDWGMTTSTALNVVNIKPLNSYQNFIDLYGESDDLLLNVQPAVIHKDSPQSDSEDITGTFSVSGIQEYTFSTKKEIDPFFYGLGLKFAVNKNCRISFEIYDENDNMQKRINFDEFRAGDIFSENIDSLVSDLTGAQTWEDVGDISLFLSEGDYTLKVLVQGINNYQNENINYIIPFEVKYDYNYRVSVDSASYNAGQGNIKINTIVERESILNPGVWEEINIERILTLYRIFLYVIDDDEKDLPIKIKELEWSNDGTIFSINMASENIGVGYKPIVVLGATRDRAYRYAGSQEGNSSVYTIEELFSNPPAGSSVFISAGSNRLGTRNYYRKAWTSDRKFKPFNIAEFREDKFKLRIGYYEGTTFVEKANGTFNTADGNKEHKRYFYFNNTQERIFFEPMGNSFGIRKGKWTVYDSDVAARFEEVKSWIVEVDELKYWTEVQGW